MDDFSTYALLISSATFVFLSFALLFRYRQVSRQITASNDLGKDLWAALEGRLKKQDERILDMMGRVEVIQSRVLERPANDEPTKTETAKTREPDSEDVVESQVVTPVIASHPEPRHVMADSEFVRAVDARFSRQDERLVDMLGRLEAIQSRLISAEPRIDFAGSRPLASHFRVSSDKVSETILIQMLGEKPRTSVEIRERFGITREHAARVLKGFFDRKLVTRNDTHKPFVYELTDAGRSVLVATGQTPTQIDTSEGASAAAS